VDVVVARSVELVRPRHYSLVGVKDSLKIEQGLMLYLENGAIHRFCSGRGKTSLGSLAYFVPTVAKAKVIGAEVSFQQVKAPNVWGSRWEMLELPIRTARPL
jgi:hypothetical protein